MYKISLLIPTSDRKKLFTNCIESIRRTTTYKENIELIVIVDLENSSTRQYVQEVVDSYKDLNIRVLVRPQSELLNADYYNWASDQSNGDLVWIFADDLEITAFDWDTAVNREVASWSNKYPDRIFCINMRDNTPSPSHKMPKFPCFPMFTREAIKALGFTLHPKPKNWGVDYINFQIFQPIDRILNIQDRNYLNHISYHTHQVEVDPTAFRIGHLFNMSKMIPHHNTDRILAEEVPPLVLQLKQRIAEFYGQEAKQMFA